MSRVFFLFKRKTEYELRISDWSSDVCSSDLETDFLDQPLHDRLEAARADILDLFVHLCRELRDACDRIVGEVQRHAFGAEQCHILFGKTGLRLAENTHKILFGERAELNADGEAALELGEQVARLGDVEDRKSTRLNSSH